MKSREPPTQSEIRKVQATWVGLCAYHEMRAELTTPSEESTSISWDLYGVELLRVKVSPPELVEPLRKLVDAYSKIAYDACDLQAWRQWATVQSETLKKLSKLTPEEKVGQELKAIHSLAQAQETHTYGNAIFPLLSQVAGEEPPALVPPSLEEVNQFFGPYMEHYYQTLGDEDIGETIDFLTWLANEANNDQIRTFVSARSGFGCLGMAQFIGMSVELAVAIGNGKEGSPIELVRQATKNHMTEALLELKSVSKGLGGDADRAAGKLWDSGIHPLAKTVHWQQINEPHIERNRLVVNQAVQDAVICLLDTAWKYANSVTIGDILLKARDPHLLNSLKKASWNSLRDDERKVRRGPKEKTLSELREELGQSGEDMSEEKVLEELLKRSKQSPVEDDTSSDSEYSLLLEQMAMEPSLTPRERQVLVLMTATAKEEKRVATLEEVGQQMGITKVRVKQLLDSASSKLRYYKPFL